jgi:hypothetical protein
MKIQKRTISRSTGHHVGIWREGRWFVIDLWRYRFEIVR